MFVFFHIDTENFMWWLAKKVMRQQGKAKRYLQHTARQGTSSKYSNIAAAFKKRRLLWTLFWLAHFIRI